jgi:hypothetical protein
MTTLGEDARNVILEMFGVIKPEQEKPKSPLQDTWVVLTLTNGNKLGGKLEYTSVRPGGTDLCLTHVHEVTSVGEWRPSEWKPVEGTQCVVLGAQEYRFMQFLDSNPFPD